MLDPDLNPLPNPHEIFDRSQEDASPINPFVYFYASALFLTALMLLALAKMLALI